MERAIELAFKVIIGVLVVVFLLHVIGKF